MPPTKVFIKPKYDWSPEKLTALVIIMVRTIQLLATPRPSYGFLELTRSFGIVGIEFGDQPCGDSHLDEEYDSM